MKKTTRLLTTTIVILTLTFPTTSAIADECKSSEEDSWICKGTEAWKNGYLVSKKILADLVHKESLLEGYKQQREEYKKISEEFQTQRDEFRTQRDELRNLLEACQGISKEYKQQREDTEKELESIEVDYEKLQIKVAELEGRVENSWSDLEVGLLSGGVAVVGILAGMGVFHLISL